MMMFKSKFKLLDAFGIPVYVDITFAFLLLILIGDFGSIDFGLAMAIMLAISITLHELAHSLTARAFGYQTRDITLSLIGGCASLISLPKKAYQELLTAAAGPAMSFALAFAFWFIPQRLFAYAAVMNLMLGLFNLLPALPMDGGRVFRSALRLFLPRVKATYIAMCVGRVLAVALVILPILGVNYIGFIPIGGSFFLRLLIAYMIWQESYREYQIALMEGEGRAWSPKDFKFKVSPPPYER